MADASNDTAPLLQADTDGSGTPGAQWRASSPRNGGQSPPTPKRGSLDVRDAAGSGQAGREEGTTLFGIELPGAAGAVLGGVADVASGMFDVTKDVTKGLVLVSFKAAGLIRSAWMETVHNYPTTAAFIDKYMADLFDPTTYQFRSYFRVHLLHFIISPLIGGAFIHLQNGIPFIDAWFSGCAAMTGGSLMPYDVSKLDRTGEIVLYILMFVGGVTIMCIPPALNRLYIFRKRLRPALHDAIALTQDVLDLAKDAHAEGAEQLESDIKDFKDMLEEYTLKDEVQEVIAIVTGVYTFVWHFFGAAGLYTTIQMRGTLPEYAARGISDAWFSVFMICSCLNNVGLSLLDDSMVPLADRPAPLMIMAFAMILGNTAWPIAFRSILIVLSRMFPHNLAMRHALDNSQQSSASLFSAAQTWGLVVAVVVSNVFMTVMFLAFSAEKVRDGRRWSTMVYLAFFQCTNARSSGLQVFDLKRISKNMLVIIGFFMWYAPTPLVGIIGGEEFNMAFSDNPVLSGFIKKYTNRHTTWIVVIYIIISTAEEHLLTGADNFPPMTTPRSTLFNILFEMMSAYGTNGLSMGFPGVNHSLSGMFRPISKVCIIFLMIMGRHRSMQGKSDPTLMISLARVEEHVVRLREQKEAMIKPAEAVRHARSHSLASLPSVVELQALENGKHEEHASDEAPGTAVDAAHAVADADTAAPL